MDRQSPEGHISQVLEDINCLLGMAETVIQLSDSEDLEVFLEATDRYLEKFSIWRESIEQDEGKLSLQQLKGNLNSSMVDHLKKLQEQHLKITNLTEAKRTEVGEGIANLHTRSRALKSYMDRFPQRITIAGKREG